MHTTNSLFVLSRSSTKKGVGGIRVTYDPLNDFWNYSGEGYQGDGEFITVPILFK